MQSAEKHLCIHGHFYQPPREDPWLGFVPPEGSAGPEHDWNERICRESYAPLARARVLGDAGRIREIVNCYEYMSFNFGPTLMHWLERGDSATYERIIQGDRDSARRLGHGNAMAQIQHHTIMPLASERDKKIETAWAVADFQARFGRDPEGVWLSEAAADLPTLDVLAEAGLRFTVLAPGQAAAVTDLSGRWRDADENGLDISAPYEVELPSGRSIAVFFYNGGISRAVAFERLLQSGEALLSRLAEASHAGLLSLATDGETYGHHFPFGEMALAYVLTRIRDDGDPDAGGLRLTNFAAFLAENPAGRKARIKEPSSWSCVHGVERWRSDCGCSTGGRPGWSQAWRAPLRAALADCRDNVDKHFFAVGADLFHEPGAALEGYGSVVADPGSMDEFAAIHFTPDADRPTAWKLLVMQRNSLASMASCSWFFDDLDRLEPINGMRYALRAMDIMRETGGEDLVPGFIRAMEAARSNREAGRTGRDLFEAHVLPARETPASIVAQAVAYRTGGLKTGTSMKASWPYVHASVEVESARLDFAGGTVRLIGRQTGEESILQWSVETDGGSLIDGAYRAVPLGGRDPASSPAFRTGGLTWRKRQALGVGIAERLENARWERDVEAARELLSSFQHLAESQQFQNRAWTWDRFRAALAYLFVTGAAEQARGRTALAFFLRQAGPCEPEKEAVRRRVEAQIVEYLQNEPPGIEATAEVLSRAAEIGLPLDFWTAQNIVWDRFPDDPEAEKLRDMLHIAPVAARTG
jgi:hypothetical protein